MLNVLGVESACYFVLLLWTSLASVWNLSRKDLPLWVSLVPLAVGLGYVAHRGQSALAAGLVFAVAATEIPSRWLRASGTTVFVLVVAILLPEYRPLAAGWAMLVLLWEIRLLYGADALAGLILLVFFPTWRMLASIGLGLFLWAGIVMALRYRLALGRRLWVVISSRSPGTIYPGLGGFALALAVYPFLRLI